MEDKVRTTIYLDRQLKNMVDVNHVNLTKVINDHLSKYFSVSNQEELVAKIKETENTLNSLKQSLADMVDMGVRETSSEALGDEALATLRSNYKIRMDDSASGDANLGWITSPANLDRCKRCGKDPDQMLKELEAWYRDSEKN